MKRYVLITAAALACILAACGERTPPQTGPGSGNSPMTAPPPVSQSPAPSPSEARSTPAASPSADRDLTIKVKQALQQPDGAPPVLSSGSVEVAASNGVVTLYGTVDAPSTKERAALVAMAVDGVRSVVNNLVVVAGS